MPEIFFFYSVDDPSVALEAIRLGNSLVVNKDYDPGEGLILLSGAANADLRSFSSFYVFPDDCFISEIAVSYGTKTTTGKDFYHIKDRVGAAAIILIMSRKPSRGEVCVGSLEFEARTYPSDSEPLQPLPAVFSSAFRSLRSFIKRSAQPVSNAKIPKTVYVFPQAMALLKQDFSLSPWPSLKIED